MSGEIEDSGGCMFCEGLQANDDEQKFILARRDRAFAMLNAFPYNTGHLMVVPYSHTGDIVELQAAERAAMFELADELVVILREAMKPDGFNLGINMGEAAGAGLADHLHLHVVPRWSGDENFMPVLGAAKVLPELVEDTFKRMRALIKDG